MSEPIINNHCDYGNHYVGENWVSVCAVCECTVCHAHQGNPDAIAGDYVACPFHVEEVQRMNEEWWQKWRATH